MKHVLIGLVFLFTLTYRSYAGTQKPIRLLILSGADKRERKQTTPVLERMFANSGYFEVSVTEQPDTLSYQILSKYDVVVSNRSSRPENSSSWTGHAKKRLLKYVEKGGGLVFFQASSSINKWEEFKHKSTPARIDSTSHEINNPVKVEISGHDHSITCGISNFYIFDELWPEVELNENFDILGYGVHDMVSEEGNGKRPVIFVSNYGQGRVFHTILGNSMCAMRNTGFKSLILRATEWAATSKVTLSVPQGIRESKMEETSEFSWVKSDTTFALHKSGKVIWQFNYNTIHGKPFFHPIYVNKNRITCISPDDHLWHLGQWFSWKFINGKNYWEYIGQSYQSEGITEIASVKLEPKADFSAKITLKVKYHPLQKKTVLTEKRVIFIAPPQKEGSVLMDYELKLKAKSDMVKLDRTPILGEPDGMSWGGYSGLSIRFNQDFMSSKFISPYGENQDVNGKTNDWLYMGFKGLDGNQVGSVIMIHDQKKREGEAWYTVNNPELPFFYISPAYLYYKPLVLPKGGRIQLKYRIIHFGGDTKAEILSNEYNQYINSVNH